MQKLIIYTLFLFLEFNAKAQMPTNGNYSNWNWEDNINLENWKRASSSSSSYWERINPPFHPETDKNGLMDDIYTKGDYKKNDGWELIWAKFGPSNVSYPYFILCNKYRGIIRAYNLHKG